jgi:hypothetical protein
LALNLANNLRLNFIIKYFNDIYGEILNKQSQALDLGKKKVKSMKAWIADSVVYSVTKDIISSGIQNGKIFLYEKVVTPIQDVTIVYSNLAANIIIKTGKWTKEVVFTLYEQLRGKLIELLGEGPLIKFTTDMQEKYLNIAINTTMIITDYEKVKEILTNFIHELASKEIIDNVNPLKLKSLLVSRFRKMIGNCEEEKPIKKSE